MAGTIIDLALAAIMLIALVVGIIRGFMRQFTSLASRIFSIVLAVILSGLLLNSITGTGIFTSFCSATTSWFDGAIYTTTVSSQEELATVLQNDGGWAALAALAPTFYTEMTALKITTFGQLIGYYVANVIVYAIIWLTIFILLKITFKAIGKLLQKVAKLPVLNTIDRILGAIWSIGLVYIVLITLMLTGVEVFVYKYVNGSWDALCSFLKQSKLLVFANNTNYFGMLLAKYVNVVLPTL